MSQGSGWMPGQGRHGKRTPWWVFTLHLVMVFVCTLGALFAWWERVWWAVIMAGMAWLSSFVLTATDNVSLPWVERAWQRGSLMIDRVRVTGDTRKTEDKSKPNTEPSEEGEQ